ncbi:MAG: alpha/beta fold hydrolase [Chlorobia bacterium]|nr:alpha/beta fold hydrolase [Fimbriimonadaceae bacterium]
MQRKRRWRRVIYFFVGLSLAYVVGCYYLASKYVRPGTTNAGPPPIGLSQTTGINAWASAIKPGQSVYILVHGYGGSQFGWTDVANGLADMGVGVVIPALPGHDNRTNETSGFALKESQIVLDTVNWAREKAGKDVKIVLVGISMGGAACWLASERDPTIHAVATEGSFARLGPATASWFDRKAPGASTYLAPVIWFAKRMSGVDPALVNPVEAAAKWKGKPSLVIHGDEDQLFPVENGKELAAASGGVCWIVKGATHAHCSDVNLREYVLKLAELSMEKN